MKHSESIKAIAAALVKAQAEMKTAEFDKKNPHFKSSYASLNSIVAASKESLSKYELSVLQSLKREGNIDLVVTTLLHSSGEWIEDEGIPLLIDKNTMQGLGSAYTYARRYGMSALLRIVADEDDDGEQAEKQNGMKERPLQGVTGYRIPFGKKYLHKTLNEVPFPELLNYRDYIVASGEKENKPLSKDAAEFVERVNKMEWERNADDANL